MKKVTTSSHLKIGDCVMLYSSQCEGFMAAIG